MKPLSRDDGHVSVTRIDSILERLRELRERPAVPYHAPRTDHNRGPRTARRFQSRMPLIVRDNTGKLMLIDDQRGANDRPLSHEMQVSFLRTIEQEARQWHSIDREDPFANGAIALAHFKGNSRSVLQLRSIPGVMPWSALKREHIGVVERTTRNWRGERYRLSRLGGNVRRNG